jgi:hypothetical protein
MFIDGSLFLSYAKSTWWIDPVATIHIINSFHIFRMRRTLQREERSIRVTNGVEAELKQLENFQ